MDYNYVELRYEIVSEYQAFDTMQCQYIIHGVIHKEHEQNYE